MVGSISWALQLKDLRLRAPNGTSVPLACSETGFCLWDGIGSGGSAWKGDGNGPGLGMFEIGFVDLFLFRFVCFDFDDWSSFSCVSL